MSPNPTPQSWDSAWSAALDELEGSLVEGERLLNHEELDHEPVAWTPPVMETPLPPEMIERAQSLLARQHELMNRTATALNSTRQNRALIGRMNQTTGARRSEASVYLDIRA